MKTIKTLLKDFLSRYSSTKTSSNNTKKPKTNENPIHEIPGDISVDSHASPKTPENTQRASEVISTARESGVDPDNHINDTDAYQKGVIDGRNSKIEETYFRKGDDGIPHFHGNPSKHSHHNDIFSMARQA